ncbi:tetratricopeptide repeat protein [Pseudomonas leptonychotis]|jgi:Flp pilus assembly protein TadD|nr:tetratricopeptide repeat protein [Pseudomonas leptonychotis]
MRVLSIALLALCLSGCAGLQPKNQIIELQQQADAAYAQANYAQASELYRRLTEKLPTDAGVRYQLGNSLARNGDNTGAIASYRDALVRDPQHARSWHNLLQVQLREATLTAAEMQRYLNTQTPYAEQALGRAEQLLELFPETE